MQEHITSLKLNRSWLALVIVYILGLIIILGHMVYSDFSHTDLSASRFKEYIKEKKKLDVKNEVENRIDEITYDYNNIVTFENNFIKENIEIIEATLIRIKRMSPNISQDQIIEEYKNIIEDEDELLYFALDTNGVLLLSGTDEGVIGNNIYNSRDKNNVYYTREMLEAVKNPDGVYVSYYWPKVKNGEPLLKTSYCKYINELDIVIGTGIYYEDILKELKERVFSRLKFYYKDKPDYIFVYDKNNIAQVHQNEDLIGIDNSYIEDYNGDSILKKMNNIIETYGKGFVSYPYIEKDSNRTSEKISYIQDLGDEWNAFIGMGFHTNEMDKDINDYLDFFQKEHLQELFVSIFIFITLTIFMFLLARRGAELQLKYFKQKDLIFEDLLALSPEGIVIVSDRAKLLYNNHIASKILGDSIDKNIGAYGYLNYERVNKNTLKVINKNSRIYYLSVRREDIIYKGIESHLYFLSDITSDFLKSNEFKKMALYDELTSLPNRRKLIYDFEDTCNESLMEKIVFGMIDLDFFKNVNDTYGHAMGDNVLKALSSVFTNRLRSQDHIYRFGGEEFIVILKDITLEKGIEVINQIKATFNKETSNRFNISVTFSGGLLEVDSNCLKYDDLDSLIEKSDTLLYKAKNSGRDKLVTKPEKCND